MEKREKNLTLAQARDFLRHAFEAADLAVEAEATERQNIKARAEFENLVKRNEQLQNENATLQAQNETLKKKFSEYASLAERTARLKDLDRLIAERTKAAQTANRDLEALRQKYAAA